MSKSAQIASILLNPSISTRDRPRDGAESQSYLGTDLGNDLEADGRNREKKNKQVPFVSRWWPNPDENDLIALENGRGVVTASLCRHILTF
jgi:hypothetical protein